MCILTLYCKQARHLLLPAHQLTTNECCHQVKPCEKEYSIYKDFETQGKQQIICASLKVFSWEGIQHQFNCCIRCRRAATAAVDCHNFFWGSGSHLLPKLKREDAVYISPQDENAENAVTNRTERWIANDGVNGTKYNQMFPDSHLTPPPLVNKDESGRRTSTSNFVVPPALSRERSFYFSADDEQADLYEESFRVASMDRKGHYLALEEFDDSLFE